MKTAFLTIGLSLAPLSGVGASADDRELQFGDMIRLENQHVHAGTKSFLDMACLADPSSPKMNVETTADNTRSGGATSTWKLEGTNGEQVGPVSFGDQVRLRNLDGGDFYLEADGTVVASKITLGTTAPTFTYARNGWCTNEDGSEYDQYSITSGVTLDECKDWCKAIPECVGLTYKNTDRCDIHSEDGFSPTVPAGFSGFGSIHTGHTGSGEVKVHVAEGSSCGSLSPCCFKLDAENHSWTVSSAEGKSGGVPHGDKVHFQAQGGFLDTRGHASCMPTVIGSLAVVLSTSNDRHNGSGTWHIHFITAPTEAPSKRPTETPTGAPSKTPSEAPSNTPSEAPSSVPTTTPSAAPTEAPSKSPTETPTGAPSKTPSEAPSNTPTEVPSSVPTTTPSAAPTEAPSKSPTETPTDTPSKTPSEAPSNTPTKAPSSVPTITLTTTPTKSGACQEHTDCGANEKCKKDQNMDTYCKKRKVDCKVRGSKKKKRWGCQNNQICMPVGNQKWAKCIWLG